MVGDEVGRDPTNRRHLLSRMHVSAGAGKAGRDRGFRVRPHRVVGGWKRALVEVIPPEGDETNVSLLAGRGARQPRRLSAPQM
jgi:hypothetical protein